jgi:biopolymer transport protein ExbD
MTLNLAPMVDVMMCLIIFFLLGSRLVAEQHHRIELPVALAAREIERDELGQRIVVNVRVARDDGADAEYVLHGWDGRSIREYVLDADGVVGYLRRRASQQSHGEQPLRCVIRADRNVPYGRVETVMRGCGLAGISRVVFSAQTSDDLTAGEARE